MCSSIYKGWSILNYPADLSSFRYVDQSRTYLVDIDEEQVKWERDNDAQEAFTLGMAIEWTDKELVAFLDRRVRQTDILQPQLIEWIRKAIGSLFDRGFDLAQLVRAKFVIAKKLAEQIKNARTAASENNYQTTLFGNDAPVLADFDHAYTFDPNAYPSSKPCIANYKWKKHYYAVPGDLPHKRASGKLAEEFQCALALDNMEEVEFWVRNIAHRSQFRLPTATGWTYPDFVARLKDGRLLVVEYKGGDRVSNDDSKAKAQMGHLWQEASNGKGIYLMAVAQDEAGRSVEEQIRDAIAK